MFFGWSCKSVSEKGRERPEGTIWELPVFSLALPYVLSLTRGVIKSPGAQDTIKQSWYCFSHKLDKLHLKCLKYILIKSENVYQLKSPNKSFGSTTVNACVSGNSTFGFSLFRTKFYYSQKSKDQRVVQGGTGRGVEGQGEEEEEEGGWGSRGREVRDQSFGFLINSVWPSLSVCLKALPLTIISPGLIYAACRSCLWVHTLFRVRTHSQSQPLCLPPWESWRARISGGPCWLNWLAWPFSFSSASQQLLGTRTTPTRTRRWRCRWPSDWPLPRWLRVWVTSVEPTWILQSPSGCWPAARSACLRPSCTLWRRCWALLWPVALCMEHVQILLMLWGSTL